MLSRLRELRSRVTYKPRLSGGSDGCGTPSSSCHFAPALETPSVQTVPSSHNTTHLPCSSAEIAIGFRGSIGCIYLRTRIRRNLFNWKTHSLPFFSLRALVSNHSRVRTDGFICAKSKFAFYLNVNSLAVFSARSAALSRPQALMHQNASSVPGWITTTVICPGLLPKTAGKRRAPDW